VSAREGELRKHLESLHRELSQTSVSEEATRASLRKLADDIEAALHDGEHAGLSARLDEAAVALDRDHPQAAAMARAVIDALVKLGF
jgi:hypothetical protein